MANLLFVQTIMSFTMHIDLSSLVPRVGNLPVKILLTKDAYLLFPEDIIF